MRHLARLKFCSAKADAQPMAESTSRPDRARHLLWTIGAFLVGFATGRLSAILVGMADAGAGAIASGAVAFVLGCGLLVTSRIVLTHTAADEGLDALTGLANRSTFYAHVTGTFDVDPNAAGALMLIDLDRFKDVNDSLGHEAGDALLQDVARRISSVLRDDDIIARLGGDEFAIYLGGVPNEATATRIARKIHDALAAPFNSAGIILDVEASVGIAVAPDHGTDVHRLMQRADVAMYSAKRSKAGFEVYDESVDPHSADRLSLTADLRRAVDNNEFLLHYQPKALLSDGRVEGVEALLRWQHPERGMVPPGVFIPIAEDNGLMKPITLWVVDEALRQAGKWRRDGLGLTISVNISVQNLHDASLTDDIAELLSKHDAEADWLRLEITESAVMEGPESALLRLAGLADMGLELSMDDYGTGYSSLTYLKQMPLSELKIDRSFVQNITADQKDALIVGSTIELGHSLGLRVVAEGVEREEDWIGLQMLGCDVAQGFFLGRPMPPEGLEAWLQENDRPYIKVTPLER